jgi:hypothetical protein
MSGQAYQQTTLHHVDFAACNSHHQTVEAGTLIATLGP